MAAKDTAARVPPGKQGRSSTLGFHHCPALNRVSPCLVRQHVRGTAREYEHVARIQAGDVAAGLNDTGPGRDHMKMREAGVGDPHRPGSMKIALKINATPQPDHTKNFIKQSVHEHDSGQAVSPSRSEISDPARGIPFLEIEMNDRFVNPDARSFAPLQATGRIRHPTNKRK